MYKNFLFIIFTVSFVLLMGDRAISACDSISHSPKLKVNIPAPQVRYIYNLSGEAFNKALGQSNELSKDGQEYLIPGFTKGKVANKVNIIEKVYELEDGSKCVFADTIEYHFGYPVIEVYVIADYAKKSCQRKWILRHEVGHIKIYKKTLLEAKAAVTKKALAAAGKIKPIKIKNDEELTPQLQNMQNLFLQEMQPFVVKYEQVLKDRNLGYDSEDTYGDLAEKCESW